MSLKTNSPIWRHRSSLPRDRGRKRLSRERKKVTLWDNREKRVYHLCIAGQCRSGDPDNFLFALVNGVSLPFWVSQKVKGMSEGIERWSDASVRERDLMKPKTPGTGILFYTFLSRCVWEREREGLSHLISPDLKRPEAAGEEKEVFAERRQ